jgi:hypothetical protein
LANRSSRHQSQPRGALRPTGTRVQAQDDRDVFQASSDELRAIDIHSL